MIRILLLSTFIISFSFASANTKQNTIGLIHPSPRWFNPYLSVGLGLDRALYVPAVGVRVKGINAQFSVFDDLTASGMASVDISADIIKLSTNGVYNNTISCGLNYYNSYSGDFTVNTINVAGVLVGLNMYKVNGRHQMYVKLGAAYYEKHHSSFDLATGESSSTLKQKLIPNVAIGFNMFLFRFRR